MPAVPGSAGLEHAAGCWKQLCRNTMQNSKEINFFSFFLMTDLCSEASELTVVLKEAVEIPILSVDFFF